jgi:hypothetical protein
MREPHIHTNRPIFSASNVRDTIALTLGQIRAEDGLTYADMGRVLGKSSDRAEAYCNGDFSDMSSFSLLAAWREWNGRFIGPIRDLVEGSRPGKVSDGSTLTVLLDLGARLAKALEDGDISAAEVRDNRSALEATRDAIDAQLAKLRPAA